MSSPMLNLLPVSAKIIIWICIAHFWIIVCAIIYVELEGFPTNHHKLPLQEIDLLVKTLSESKIDIGDLKNNPIKRAHFQKIYEQNSRINDKWSARRQFNDISKSYVFVLLSHTAIGSHNNLHLQTWQAQLFYIVSMPLGLVFYYFMIHQIASEIFEVYAYAAVTVFQRTQLAWTVDQRELYEKFKVFILAWIMFIATLYLLGLLGLLSGKSYLAGVYWMTNLMFMVSSSEELFPYADISHNIVACLMTFLIFSIVLVSYTLLYSLFIMFRYNGITEIFDMLFADADEMNDITTNEDEEHEFTVNNEDDFWWEKGHFEHIGEIPIQAKLNLANIQPGPKYTFPQIYTSTSESSHVSSDMEEELNFKENLPKTELPEKPTFATYAKRIQPNYKGAPSIEITNATPSPDSMRKSNLLDNYAPSDFTNISLQDEQTK